MLNFFHCHIMFILLLAHSTVLYWYTPIAKVYHYLSKKEEPSRNDIYFIGVFYSHLEIMMSRQICIHVAVMCVFQAIIRIDIELYR